MASGGVFISPVRRTHNDSFITISSSPDLPALDELFKRPKKPVLRSGSNAAPIPEAAPTTFTSAKSLWQAALGEPDILGDDGLDARKAHLQSSTIAPISKGTTARPSAGDDAPCEPVAAEKPKRGRKPKAPGEAKPKTTTIKRAKKGADTADKVDKIAEDANKRDGTASPEKPWKKYKTDEVVGEEQATLVKTKTTKPRGPRKKAETVSRHFPKTSQEEVTKMAAVIARDDPIELEPATKRRTDWTPPADQIIQIISDSSAAKGMTSPGDNSFSQVPVLAGGTFKGLLNNFACKTDAMQPPPAALSTVAAPDILGKRKLIEMVGVEPGVGASEAKAMEVKTPEVSPTKSKAPKKPRTITDLATAAYRVLDTSGDDTAPLLPDSESLLRYFAADDAQPAATNNEADIMAPKKKPGRPKKPAGSKVSKKKAEIQTLMSPESALKQVSGQDFVFGTSSQLATEQDPTLLRALQQAMFLSNTDVNPFASSSPAPAEVKAPAPTKKLWRAGARDAEGDLLDVEVIDLADSPAIPQDYTLPAVALTMDRNVEVAKPVMQPPAVRTTATKPAVFVIDSSDYEDLTNSPLPGNSKSHFFSTQKATTTLPAVKKTLSSVAPARVEPQHTEEPVASVELDSEPPASNQEQFEIMQHSQPSNLPAKKAKEPRKRAAKQAKAVTRPTYELFTDAKLAKEVASFGFKAVKARSAMITLLYQCWDSKHKPGAEAVQPVTQTSLSKQVEPAATASAASPKRPRGRPRKDSVSGDEEPAAASTPEKRPVGRPRKSSISSSDEALAASALAAKKPRGRPRKVIGAEGPKSPKTSRAKGTSKAKGKAQTSSMPPPPVPAVSTPKRKKTQSQPVHEIADSDDDGGANPFLSSSASSTPEKAGTFSSPLPVDLSINEETELSLAMSPSTQEMSVFHYITQAVKTAPRTTDPLKPSWHEKMLMYDPIILEDLAAWLNSGQLDRVGYDREVGAGDVKRWCESQSVCCVWKVNLHGKERKVI